MTPTGEDHHGSRRPREHSGRKAAVGGQGETYPKGVPMPDFDVEVTSKNHLWPIHLPIRFRTPV